MWGEGASDLWGRLQQDEDEREAGLLAAVHEHLRDADAGDGEAGEPKASLAGLGDAD